MKEAEQIIAESYVKDIRSILDSNVDQTEAFEQHGIISEWNKLQEQMSSDDWSRLGVLAGLLWYKLDSLIKHLDDAGSTLKSIERNTGKR